VTSDCDCGSQFFVSLNPSLFHFPSSGLLGLQSPVVLDKFFEMVFSSYLHKNPLASMGGSIASRSSSDYFRMICLTLATLSTMLSVAVLGTVGHSYHLYQIQTAANNPWWLPLWPQHFDTTGTRALIGAGAGITLLNLVYITVSVVPKVCIRTLTCRA
jgi:hypothetical protein